MTTTEQLNEKLEAARNKAREWVKDNPDYITSGDHFLSVCHKDDPGMPLGTMPGTQYCAPKSLIPILEELIEAEWAALELVTV